MRVLTFLRKESKEAFEFMDKHFQKCPNTNFTFRFGSDSGIGTATHIKCEICKEEKDITDYDAW